ncbi:PAS domain-containing protein [Ktedonobacter sp. SOSP1-52]|uniref:PAS domain-containing protein n=1 Tax=Ktedonobacter sp. SOSP1-52 TaxID=2778366 RepID=UPI0027DAD332|nr:PAS domain-containing protein [Ktedonobacter sp. SOSP1-52]
MFPQGEHLCIDDLDGLQIRTAILTPEGIVLAIDAIPLNNAQVRCEKVIGQPLAEAPWWSLSPATQEQLCAAIVRASTGETVRFETVFHPREGMDLHLEVAITPHMDVDHHVAYLVMIGFDITTRKRAEAAIHTLIDAIPSWSGPSDQEAISTIAINAGATIQA